MAQNQAWATGISGVAGSLASADFGSGAKKNQYPDSPDSEWKSYYPEE